MRPVYPESMRAAGLAGEVRTATINGTNGTVRSIRVLTGTAHPDLAEAAVTAVRAWQFSPTLLNGVAVEVAMNVSVSFSVTVGGD